MEEETQLLKQHLVTIVWQIVYHSSDWTISKRDSQMRVQGCEAAYD